MSGLRRYDAFVKTRADMRTKSAVGGVITLIASTTALLLFLGQIVLYIWGTPQHSLHLASSRSFPLRPLNLSPFQARVLEQIGSIHMQMKITFPHLNCQRLDVHHDGASLIQKELSKHHPGHSIEMRTPHASELTTIVQHAKSKERFKPSEGCTIEGEMYVPLVSGSLVIGMNAMAWSEVTTLLSLRRMEASQDNFDQQMAHFNVTHYIHHLRFGDPFPLAKHKPLEQRYNWIQNSFGGLALEQIEVKLVPTHMTEGWFFSTLGVFSSRPLYQMSVTDHQVQPATLVSHGVPQLPGLLVTYDFSPIEVRHRGGRDNILIFLSSLVSIVGGVFVTVGLLTSCLVHSAKAVAKKVD